jgi:hypothetical protein
LATGWEWSGPLGASAPLVLAGAFQFSSLKYRCLGTLSSDARSGRAPERDCYFRAVATTVDGRLGFVTGLCVGQRWVGDRRGDRPVARQGPRAPDAICRAGEIALLSRAGYRPRLEAGVRAFEWNGRCSTRGPPWLTGGGPGWARRTSTWRAGSGTSTWTWWRTGASRARSKRCSSGDQSHATEIVLRARRPVSTSASVRRRCPDGPQGRAGPAEARVTAVSGTGLAGLARPGSVRPVALGRQFGVSRVKTVASKGPAS